MENNLFMKCLSRKKSMSDRDLYLDFLTSTGAFFGKRPENLYLAFKNFQKEYDGLFRHLELDDIVKFFNRDLWEKYWSLSIGQSNTKCVKDHIKFRVLRSLFFLCNMYAIKKYIESNNIDINAPDENNETILFDAVDDLVFPDNEHDSTLIYVYNQKDKLIRWLIDEKKADINHINNSGHTILAIAVINNSYLKFKYLLDRGADINYNKDNGSKLLCYAIDNENKDIVNLLLQKGASLEQNTPLRYHTYIKEQQQKTRAQEQQRRRAQQKTRAQEQQRRRVQQKTRAQEQQRRRVQQKSQVEKLHKDVQEEIKNPLQGKGGGNYDKKIGRVYEIDQSIHMLYEKIASSQKIPSIFSYEKINRDSLISSFNKRQKLIISAYLDYNEIPPLLGLLLHNLKSVAPSRFRSGHTDYLLISSYVDIVKKKYIQSIQNDTVREVATTLLGYFSHLKDQDDV